MVKHEFTKAQTAKICDYVEAGKDEEQQKERRAALAEKHGVTIETIVAITAHITIRRNKAVEKVSEIMRGRKNRGNRAEEALQFGKDSKLPKLQRFERHMDDRAKNIDASSDALELLKRGDLYGAIAVFGQAGDADALEAIAEVYTSGRPEIAVEALNTAGSLDGVLEVATLQLRLGNRALAKKLLSDPQVNKKK